MLSSWYGLVCTAGSLCSSAACGVPELLPAVMVAGLHACSSAAACCSGDSSDMAAASPALWGSRMYWPGRSRERGEMVSGDLWRDHGGSMHAHL